MWYWANFCNVKKTNVVWEGDLVVFVETLLVEILFYLVVCLMCNK